MHRRDLFRRTLLAVAGVGGAASASAREFPDGYDASEELARADWQPKFLDDHQNQTLIVLSDLIIPSTVAPTTAAPGAAGTPGAKAALANRFIDRVLAAETPETQRAFIESLAYLDGECMVRYRTAFRHTPTESQLEFLRLLAYPHSLGTWGSEAGGEFRGHTHFTRLKDWVSRAYYNSEIGLRELGWEGPPHGEFTGCTHREGEHN